MLCPRCSHNVDDRYRLCDRCGAEMPPLTAQPQQDFQDETKTAAEQTPPPYYGYYQQPPVTPPPSYGYGQQSYGQYGYSQYGYGNPYGYTNPDDKPDTALNVLSFFIPILGLVLYFIEKDTKPNKAKAALKWSLISWGVTAVFLVIYFIFVFGMVFMLGM